ncbi:MAG: alpha-beta hydrolase superfamily lysophospholipase, partial [Patiriisocius sp.]
MKTQILKSVFSIVVLTVLSFSLVSFTNVKHEQKETLTEKTAEPTSYKNVAVNGLNIFYREAGDVNKPTILLLHGYPTSSHMFRNLITDLSVRYHVLAPDYPGFGRSEQPLMKDFDYTFDNMANIVEGFLATLNVEKYSIY